MKKNLISFVLLALVLMPMAHAANSDNILFSWIRFNQGSSLKADSDVEARINIENTADADLDDLRVSFSMPEFGVWRRAGPFDLDDDKTTIKTTMLPLYDAEPGWDYVRVTVRSHQHARTKYVPVYIE